MPFFNLLAISYTFYGEYAWLNDVYETLPTILYLILACVGGAGIIYSIILGVNLAKAESEDVRKKASSRLINTIVGVAVLLFLVMFINLLLPMILNAVLPKEPSGDPTETPGGEGLISALKMLIK